MRGKNYKVNRFPLSKIPEGHSPNNYIAEVLGNIRTYTRINPEDGLSLAEYNALRMKKRQTTRRIIGATALATAITLPAVAGRSLGDFNDIAQDANLDNSSTPLLEIETPTLEYREYIVQDGEYLWNIIEKQYPDVQNIGNFIEDNVINETADYKGRAKSDLRPGDLLQIIEPGDDPSMEQ